MWWRFRRHRLAVISTLIVILFYLVALFAEFVAYAEPHNMEAALIHIPPQPIHLFDGARLRLHVHALKRERDPATLKLSYAADPEKTVGVRFFARGFEYKLLEFAADRRSREETEDFRRYFLLKEKY